MAKRSRFSWAAKAGFSLSISCCSKFMIHAKTVYDFSVHFWLSSCWLKPVQRSKNFEIISKLEIPASSNAYWGRSVWLRFWFIPHGIINFLNCVFFEWRNNKVSYLKNINIANQKSQPTTQKSNEIIFRLPWLLRRHFQYQTITPHDLLSARSTCSAYANYGFGAAR